MWNIKKCTEKKQKSHINPHLEADPISTLLYILSTLRLQSIYYFVSPFFSLHNTLWTFFQCSQLFVRITIWKCLHSHPLFDMPRFIYPPPCFGCYFSFLFVVIWGPGDWRLGFAHLLLVHSWLTHTTSKPEVFSLDNGNESASWDFYKAEMRWHI